MRGFCALSVLPGGSTVTRHIHADFIAKLEAIGKGLFRAVDLYGDPVTASEEVPLPGRKRLARIESQGFYPDLKYLTPII